MDHLRYPYPILHEAPTASHPTAYTVDLCQHIQQRSLTNMLMLVISSHFLHYSSCSATGGWEAKASMSEHVQEVADSGSNAAAIADMEETINGMLQKIRYIKDLVLTIRGREEENRNTIDQ